MPSYKGYAHYGGRVAVGREQPDVAERQWRAQVVELLTRIAECVEQLLLAVSVEVPVRIESAAGKGEVPDNAELLSTWILTDGQVAAVERAIEEEQRVRGGAYGG